MRKRKKKKKMDLKVKVIMYLLGIILSISAIYLSITYSFTFSFINEIFYSVFHSLNNKYDIVGSNLNLELKDEVNDLKNQLEIEYLLSDFEILNGVVVSRNPSFWLDEIVVNRGSRDGVEKGSAVVIGEGLVGYIKEAYNNYSVVNLITNSNFNNTSVKINDSYLILEFDNNNNLIIKTSDNFKVGDVVFTSGLTDKYPSGITIGYVSKIENNSYETGKILYVSLYYDLNDIRYVSILKRLI